MLTLALDEVRQGKIALLLMAYCTAHPGIKLSVRSAKDREYVAPLIGISVRDLEELSFVLEDLADTPHRFRPPPVPHAKPSWAKWLFSW